MILEGWKAMASHASDFTRRDITADGMRKMAERDVELARIVTHGPNGKPGVDRYRFDRWLAMSMLPKARARRMSAFIAVQENLWLTNGSAPEKGKTKWRIPNHWMAL